MQIASLKFQCLRFWRRTHSPPLWRPSVPSSRIVSGSLSRLETRCSIVLRGNVNGQLLASGAATGNQNRKSRGPIRKRKLPIDGHAPLKVTVSQSTANSVYCQLNPFVAVTWSQGFGFSLGLAWPITVWIIQKTLKKSSSEPETNQRAKEQQHQQQQQQQQQQKKQQKEPKKK